MKELHRIYQSTFPVYLVFSFYREIKLWIKAKSCTGKSIQLGRAGSPHSGGFRSQGSAGPVMREGD